MPDDQIQPGRPSRGRRYEDEEEDFDDRPRRRRRRDDYEDEDDYRIRRRGDGGLNALIPYRNPTALTGYYLAVFSLIPCVGLLLGPAAVILGIVGMKFRNKNPEAGGLGHAITALVLGGLTTLGNWGFVAFVVVLALIS
jgi:hypothetical protein